MCGRYYVDDETAREIEKLVRQVDEKLKRESQMAVKKIVPKDIYPTEKAPILLNRGGHVYCSWQQWGFPAFQGKRPIINARCESVMEKPLFRDSILQRRAVIPATWFYEWNSQKQKYTFLKQDQTVLFMAGCCRRYDDGEHFVILTTAANDSVRPVHDRMPLIIGQDEVMEWMLDNGKVEDFLHKKPCLLERRTDYEQLTLF